MWALPGLSIPHLTELQKKYKDKGVTFIGVSVWEQDQNAVAPFVKAMGDQMDYTVAIDDDPRGREGEQAEHGRELDGGRRPARHSDGLHREGWQGRLDRPPDGMDEAAREVPPRSSTSRPPPVSTVSRRYVEPREAVNESERRNLGLSLTSAAKQAWLGQEKEYSATCDRVLEVAKDTKDPTKAERAAKICSLRPSDDKTHEAALVLARRAVELGKGHGLLVYFQMALGMAEYRMRPLRSGRCGADSPRPSSESRITTCPARRRSIGR